MRGIEQLKLVLLKIKASGKIDTEVLKKLSKSEQEIVFALYEENLISEGLLF